MYVASPLLCRPGDSYCVNRAEFALLSSALDFSAKAARLASAALAHATPLRPQN